tara:strand:- start:93 stop:437 length:345 start_codon:yes stop_codon:yes gene_type:complete
MDNYEISINWNNHSLIKKFNFNNINVIKLYPFFPIVCLLCDKYENNARIKFYKNNIKFFDSLNLNIPKKMYKLYSYKKKKLYTYGHETESYTIFFDIMEKYNIKFLKDLYIIKI